MGDPFSRRNNPPFRTEYEDGSQPRLSHSFARPSGKSIYNQRKDYSQSLFKPQNDFQHHVEHLLTARLERDVRSAQDCVERLKVLEAQGRVWGQDLILQVKDQELVLRDVESKEELDTYPLGSIQGCWAVLDACSYDSVLAISVQERSPPGTSVLLFQCERLGAEALKSSLEKLVKQWKEGQRGDYGSRNSLDTLPSLAPPYAAPERWAETPEPDIHVPPQRGAPSSNYSLPDPQQMPRTAPLGEVTPDVERDVEVLNHVLEDLDLFMVQLKTALGLGSTTKLKKKKKKKSALPPEEDYTAFFQKVKYAINLVGRTHQHMREPDPSELLYLIFTSLSFVLDHCPSPSLAPEAEAPLLLPEALELLERTLHQDHYRTWKSLGMAWNKTRAEYPNGALVPRYVPVFSNGWLPHPMKQSPAASLSDNPGQEPPLPIPRPPLPTQGLARALYDFQGRNPQELTIRMGDTVQVLDQQKKWWLVQDSQGERGYVPSNILETLGQGGSPSASQLQESPPNLHPDSSPAEVTAWLKDKGFSRITVRCLGVLRGHQLLQMSPEELRAVCPEEWRRVLFKLSAVRTSLGMSPRH